MHSISTFDPSESSDAHSAKMVIEDHVEEERQFFVPIADEMQEFMRRYVDSRVGEDGVEEKLEEALKQIKNLKLTTDMQVHSLRLDMERSYTTKAETERMINLQEKKIVTANSRVDGFDQLIKKLEAHVQDARSKSDQLSVKNSGLDTRITMLVQKNAALEIASETLGSDVREIQSQVGKIQAAQKALEGKLTTTDNVPENLKKFLSSPDIANLQTLVMQDMNRKMQEMEHRLNENINKNKSIVKSFAETIRGVTKTPAEEAKGGAGARSSAVNDTRTDDEKKQAAALERASGVEGGDEEKLRRAAALAKDAAVKAETGKKKK
jgi:chromosome segregation ATPase